MLVDGRTPIRTSRLVAIRDETRCELLHASVYDGPILNQRRFSWTAIADDVLAAGMVCHPFYITGLAKTSCDHIRIDSAELLASPPAVHQYRDIALMHTCLLLICFT